MSNKMNMSFFKAYIELDKACSKLLSVEKHGVSAYISNLVSMRFAPGRSDALSRLTRYRKIRNILAHEENAFKEIDDISKNDIQWINRFTKSVSSKRDPVSRYMRKERFYNIWKKLRIAVYIILAALGGGAIYFIIDIISKSVAK